jgi:hypothetical protein
LGEFVIDGVDPEEALVALAPGALEPVFGLQGEYSEPIRPPIPM